MERISSSSAYRDNLNKILTSIEKKRCMLDSFLSYVVSVTDVENTQSIVILTETKSDIEYLNDRIIVLFKNLKEITYFTFKSSEVYRFSVDSNVCLKNTHSKDFSFDVSLIFDFSSLYEFGISNSFADCIVHKLNDLNATVFSFVIPYGISPDTGNRAEVSLRSNFIISYEGVLPVYYLAPLRFSCGNIVVLKNNIVHTDDDDSEIFLIEEADVKKWIGTTDPNSNKGDNGRVIIICGSESYPGAAIMCVGASVSAGAGYTYAIIPECLYKIVNNIPDAIYVKAQEINHSIFNSYNESLIIQRIKGKDAICIGPGLENMDNYNLMQRILESGMPLVLDAGALNYLSKERNLLKFLHKNVILTPHPGELSRLIDEPVESIISDPIFYAKTTARRFKCNIILKGASSCISNGDRVYINISGDEGLAKGGSGDVLSGILTAFLAKGLNALNAAACASYVLGTSAENAYNILNKRALMHSDIIECIKDAVKI